MKFKKIKKDNRKKIIIWLSVTLLLVMGVVGFIGTRAKYKYTAEYPLVSGTIHYKSGDLSVLAVNIENDSGGFIETDSIPSEGYILNMDESYCGLSNGDGTYNKLNDITITYANGKVTVSNLSQRGTKCFLYFNKPNYLVVSMGAEGYTNDVLGKEIARSSFEAITILDSKTVPASVIDSWDASARQNGSIMAWYTDTNNNGLYELYIGQDGGVIANPNSTFIFSGYSKLTSLDLSHFNTSQVTDMGYMFAGMTSLINLNVNSFDTSNVISMHDMFSGMTSLTSLNVSSFDTSKVIDMSSMFLSSSSLTMLDLSNFKTSNVMYMAGMFGNMASLQTLILNNATFDNVTIYFDMFRLPNVNTIYVKDVNAENFINARLSDAGKTATVTIA